MLEFKSAKRKDRQEAHGQSINRKLEEYQGKYHLIINHLHFQFKNKFGEPVNSGVRDAAKPDQGKVNMNTDQSPQKRLQTQPSNAGQ